MISSPTFSGLTLAALIAASTLPGEACGATGEAQLRGTPIPTISLNEVHAGSVEIDLRLLESYAPAPEPVRAFFKKARTAFDQTNQAIHFSDAAILQAAADHGISLLGGPMLGNVSADGISLWLRPATTQPLTLTVRDEDGARVHENTMTNPRPGVEARMLIDGLDANTTYRYALTTGEQLLAEGGFMTAPGEDFKGSYRIAFGADFHKIGLHNSALFEQILARAPSAMLLLGDSAADDRRENMNLHRADYLLRDVSKPWGKFAAEVPVYAIWDDHDYFDDDLSGLQEGKFTDADRQAIREVWRRNWNNPPGPKSAEGIYFKTRLGPVEVFMLDTRSYRDHATRGAYTSFLGAAQQQWLLDGLRTSTAPFKLLCSGTMWSDYVSKGKDSWTEWDKEALEEIFSLIEEESIGGVLLLSGDRHGARGFRIPRPSGLELIELEVGSLGGINGPPGLAEDAETQIFGYDGEGFTAFGEFTFDTAAGKPTVTFRLISDRGDILETHTWTSDQLTSRKPE